MHNIVILCKILAYMQWNIWCYIDIYSINIDIYLSNTAFYHKKLYTYLSIFFNVVQYFFHCLLKYCVQYWETRTINCNSYNIQKNNQNTWNPKKYISYLPILYELQLTVWHWFEWTLNEQLKIHSSGSTRIAADQDCASEFVETYAARQMPWKQVMWNGGQHLRGRQMTAKRGAMKCWPRRSPRLKIESEIIVLNFYQQGYLLQWMGQALINTWDITIQSRGFAERHHR